MPHDSTVLNVSSSVTVW